jgi:hypothetical protein
LLLSTPAAAAQIAAVISSCQHYHYWLVNVLTNQHSAFACLLLAHGSRSAPFHHYGINVAVLCRLSELAEPYWVLKDAGFDVTVASPNGGAVPVDPNSLAGDFKTAEADRMLNDGQLQLCATAETLHLLLLLLLLLLWRLSFADNMNSARHYNVWTMMQ